MALHFVSNGFCGLVNFALLETSAERKTLRSLDAELPFSLQRISNFVRRFFLSLHCHGCMDFELTS